MNSIYNIKRFITILKITKLSKKFIIKKLNLSGF